MGYLADLDLVKIEYGEDSIGQKIIVSSTHNFVVAKIESVSEKEVYDAHQVNLSPEVKAIVSVFDYDGEKECVFNDEEYVVIRTYRNGDRMELYLGQKVGEND